MRLNKNFVIVSNSDDKIASQINCLTWIGGISVSALLLMCVIFFCRGCSLRETDNRHTLQTDNKCSSFPFKISQIKQIDDSVKVSVASFRQSLDTLQKKNQSLEHIYGVISLDKNAVHTICQNQEAINGNILYLNYRIDSIAKISDNLINDVRQETNNNIDKSNTWISFWLAIIAFVGVIIPWVWQIRLNRDEARKYDELEKTSKAKIEELVKQAESSKWSKELELLTSLLSKCSDHRLIEEIRGSSSLEQEIWRNIRDDFKQLIELAFDKHDGKKPYHLKESSIMTLISALTNIFELLTQEARDTQKQFDRKVYRDLTDRIRIAIRNLAQRRITQTNTYHELDNICKLLNQFPFENRQPNG